MKDFKELLKEIIPKLYFNQYAADFVCFCLVEAYTRENYTLIRYYLDEEMGKYDFNKILEEQGETGIYKELLGKWKLIKILDTTLMEIIEKQLT